MKQERISAKDFFVLADDISRMIMKAAAMSQTAAQVYLQSAQLSVLEGAKSVAFTEALERHTEEVSARELAETNG